MKTTLLLGAGATCAEAETEGIAKDQFPPLDATLFSCAAELGLEELDKVNWFTKDELGLDITQPNISMEEVFNALFILSDIESRQRIKAKGTLRLLSRMTLLAVAQRTNGLTCRTQSGLLGLFRFLVERLGNKAHDDLRVISFNWDVLAEKALANLSEPYSAASQNYVDTLSCYHLDFKDFLHPPPGFPQDRFASTMDGETLGILKLHGSLNWFMEVPDLEADFNPLPDADYPLLCYQGLEVYTHPNMTLSHKESRGHQTKVFLRPLFVPPLYEKSQFYAKTLKPLWQKAHAVLEETEWLIAFGYSLPPADIKASVILWNALTKNDALKRLDIINTDPSVCERYEKATGIGGWRSAGSVEEFIASGASSDLI